jgi:hypothetical protein
MLSRKLNNLITEGAWREKELIQTKKELDKLRKRQGFSKIARAFMAIGEDPTLANITTSLLQSNSGDTQDNVNVDQPEPINLKKTADSEEFTIGDLSQGEDTNKITDQLQADLLRIEKEFQAVMQTLSSERTAHNQERTSLLNESMEIKKAMIDSKCENDRLRDELNSKLQHQQELIRELTEESLRLTRQQLLSPVQTNSQNSVPTVPVNRISSPIQKMLNNCENLDEDTKKHLFQNALLTNNDALQRELMNLQHNKISSSISLQAKLAKELMKISETYKIPELAFDSKAKMRHSNYFTWCSKLRPILAMFPQTSKVFHDNEVIPYENPEDIGNKALYILISSKVDEYFQRAIKQFEGYGDKALSFIKIQCAHINSEDTHHFHHLFTTLRIKDNESATNFFRHFTFARTEAEAAGNTYTEQQLVSFALAGMNNTSNSRYDIALQLY